jgi:hypothetical protein
MRIGARFLLLIPISSLLLMTGCVYVGDWGDSDAFKEDFHSSYPLNPGGTVSLESFNGTIEIVGWEQNSVEVNGTKMASTKHALDAIKLDTTSTPGSLRIRAIRPSEFQRMGIRFNLRVPHKVVLDLISTSNGKIQVEDTDGTVRLHTSNGAVRLSHVKGEMEVRTSNGAIDAQSVEGNTRFHTSNGSIRAELLHGSFEATTSNGSIEARMRDADPSRPVHVESSNGHVDLTVEGKSLPEVRASTSNSSMVVRLPATANARVRASTSHSAITSEFDELATARGRRHNDLDGMLGRGGPLLDLHSSNGAIKIMKSLARDQ